jgi:Mce-associated membrane protein
MSAGTDASSDSPPAEPPDPHEAETLSATAPLPTRGKVALIAAAAIVVALAALVGALGWRYNQATLSQQQRAQFLQVGRQAALNLTTIDYTHVDADVKRILDSATGTFHDEFQSRSKPFIEVVRQAQSTTVGTITEAGVQSESADQAQVLVAVTVKTSNAGIDQPQTRAWRMRIDLQQLAGGTKVSNVEFVS